MTNLKLLASLTPAGAPKPEGGTILSDLAALCPADSVSSLRTADRWTLRAYETASGVSGTMLTAGVYTQPPAVTVTPQVTGLCRIYVCLGDLDGGNTKIDLRLSGDATWHRMHCGNMGVGHWSVFEYLEESYWRIADMTGRSVEIRKRATCPAHSAAIAWLRFVPLTAEEQAALQEAKPIIQSTRSLHNYTDMDELGSQGEFDAAERYAAAEIVGNGDAGIFSVDVSWIKSDYTVDYVPFSDYDRCCNAAHAAFWKEAGTNLRMYAERAHAKGLKLYAAERMGLSHFSFPYYGRPRFDMPMLDAHPELCCANRDGSRLGFLSYAYEDVWEEAISYFRPAIESGFDGVTPMFHRGVQVLFEEPVCRRVKELYGEDARTLPYGDVRLNSVWREFMTGFMRRLRQRLDEWSAELGRGRLGINPIVYKGLEDGFCAGLDPEAWAAEGLIDSITTSNMLVWEELDGLWDENNPGHIDLERYTAAQRTAELSPIRRNPGFELERAVATVPEFMRVSRKYGIPVYFEIAWERGKPSVYLEQARALYAAGAEHLSVWDTSWGRTEYLPEWNVVSSLGHRELLPFFNEEQRRLHRITVSDGMDISGFNPSWRG